jgi:hypothetical protein
MEAQLEEDKKEEEKDGKKLKATKSGPEGKWEPALADVKLAPTKSEGAAESHVKGGKGDKPDKKSKKDKE